MYKITIEKDSSYAGYYDSITIEQEESSVEQKMKSMPRNKMILNTLYKSKDVEIFGSGFRKVYAYCNKEKIKTEFNSAHGGFSFVFYRDIKNQNVTTNVTIKKGATEDSVYQLLKENPTQTREELAKHLNKTVRTIQRALDKLSEAGKINRIGSNKTGYWEVF